MYGPWISSFRSSGSSMGRRPLPLVSTRERAAAHGHPPPLLYMLTITSLPPSLTGHQSALGAVSGPTEVRIRDELTDRATLEINYSPLNGTAGESVRSLPAPFVSHGEFRLMDQIPDCRTGITAASFTTALHSALSSVILLHLYPRSLIQLQLLTTDIPAQSYLPPSLQSTLNKPLSHFTRRTIRPSRPHPDASMDVSEKAALINAGMMALIQAGVPCLATVCAVGVAILPKQLAQGLRRGGKQSRKSGSTAMQEDDDSGDR